MKIGNQSGAEAPTDQNWDLYRFFLAVARAGSIAGASTDLRESPATVGRKIRELETALSATVFDRGVSGVKLTSCGSQILPHAEQLERGVMTISDTIFNDNGQTKGTVKVTAPGGLGQILLAPRLKELHDLYPFVRVQLTLSTRRLNLLNREADIAVRIGAPDQERLIGKKLCQIGFGIYASHEYLQELSPFRTVDDLTGHNIIAATGSLAHTKQSVEFARISDRCNVALATDNIHAQLEAVKSGLGLAAFPRYLGDANSDLVELLPGILQSTDDLWILMHPDLRDIARIRLVSDFISDICKHALSDHKPTASAQTM